MLPLRSAPLWYFIMRGCCWTSDVSFLEEAEVGSVEKVVRKMMSRSGEKAEEAIFVFGTGEERVKCGWFYRGKYTRYIRWDFEFEKFKIVSTIAVFSIIFEILTVIHISLFHFNNCYFWVYIKGRN